MPGKRDARPERQSSWLSSLAEVRRKLDAWLGPLELCFSAFVLWHFSVQAYRAASDGALPEPGFERAPELVSALFLLLWLPFTLLGLRRAGRAFTAAPLPAVNAQERALATIEPVALGVVLLFGTVHGAQMAWPLLSGTLTEIDLRPELVAGLSSTWRGVPLSAIVYLCAVGAASFYAARRTLAALPVGRIGLSRAVVGVAVLAYLLGSYAVIRCGSGSLLP